MRVKDNCPIIRRSIYPCFGRRLGFCACFRYLSSSIRTARARDPSSTAQVDNYITQAGQRPTKDIFALFRRIVDTYVSAGSELEINIGTALRKGVLEVGQRTNRFISCCLIVV